MGIAKPPHRLWIALLIFFITYITHTMMVNISQNITCMLNAHNREIYKNVGSSNPNYVKPIRDILNNETITNGFAPATWSHEVIFYIINSYFWGFVLFSAPTGFVSERYGPYSTILYSLILMVFINSLCVRAAEWHYAPLIVCRIILGALTAAILAGLQNLITNWSPPAEKGKFTCTLVGSTLGMLISWNLVTPISKQFGWDWGFHFLSIQAAVISLIFGIVASDGPAENKWVSSDEKKLIKESQGNLVSNLKVFLPYRKLVTSKPFWAMCICRFGSVWGFYFKFHLIYSYMVINYDERFFLYSPEMLWTAVLSLIMEICVGIGSGYVDDLLKIKIPSNKTAIRRCFVVFSHILPGLLLVLSNLILRYTSVSYYVFDILFTITCGLTGTSVGTDLQNVQDLAPNYASSTNGIINFIAGLAAFIVPNIFRMLDLTIDGLPLATANMLTTGCIYVITGLLFAIFASAQTQEWNYKLGQRLEEETPIRTENPDNNGTSNVDDYTSLNV